MLSKSSLKIRVGGISPEILKENKHIFGISKKGKTHICSTEKKGQNRPRKIEHSIEEIRVGTQGFIPLWAANQTLRWRVNMLSMEYFENADEARQYFVDLLSFGLSMWDDAVPIHFKYDEALYDFELVMKSNDYCEQGSCTMASAFFPDGGRHQLEFYPFMFEFSDEEIFDTMAHELGHIFGLRHFFANISERYDPSELFGEDNAFSIMNYGELSKISESDIRDLKELYRQAWSGELTHINETPIRLQTPYTSNQ